MTLAEMPLRQIAAQHPAAIQIFDRFEIDLCRMGEKSLADACASLSLSTEQLQEKIAGLASFSGCETEARDLSMTQLIQRIVRVHHRRVRQDLPGLVAMAAKLEANHSRSNPEVAPLARLTSELHRDLLGHINREEQVLFPFIVHMEEDAILSYPADHECFQTLRTPVAHMMQDHDAADALMEEMRQRTNDFKPRRDACATKLALFSGLSDFGGDLREHVRLENEVLFPRALALESELGAKGA